MSILTLNDDQLVGVIVAVDIGFRALKEHNREAHVAHAIEKLLDLLGAVAIGHVAFDAHLKLACGIDHWEDNSDVRYLNMLKLGVHFISSVKLFFCMLLFDRSSSFSLRKFSVLQNVVSISPHRIEPMSAQDASSSSKAEDVCF